MKYHGKSYLDEMLFNLTLEIICLLTGETYPPVMCKEHVIIKTLPNHFMSMRRHNNNKKKILEVTKKIIELLTGEVPLRSQDVTVYFSMEEWEYLEGHKDLYKDVMMEDEPDGSRKRSPPRPRDSTPKDLAISHQEQGEERVLVGVDLDQEENPPQRCLRPRDSSWKDHAIIPYHDKGSGPLAIKVEDFDDEEEQNASWKQHIAGKKGKELLKVVKVEEDDIEAELDTGNNNTKSTLRKYGDCSSGGKEIMRGYHGEHTHSHKIWLGVHGMQRSSDDANHGQTVNQHVQTTKQPFKCPECDKLFLKQSEFVKHQRVHTGEKPFLCLQCGKRYTNRSVLVKHQKLHTGVKPFSCSDCGKCFSQKAHLHRHQKLHTGEKPVMCPDCGKRFSRKSNLIDHQRIHTGEKPFPCPKCERSFTQKSILIRHQKTHREENDVICSDCGNYYCDHLAQQNHDMGEHTGLPQCPNYFY